MEHASPITYSTYESRGFTLIETVIAFGVLTAAILGPVTLVAFSLGQTRSSQNKLIATNISQEGVELVRAIRENNVICDIPPGTVPWNADPGGGAALGAGTNNLFTVDANARTTLSACGTVSTPLPTADTACDTRTLNLDANGIYTYGTGTPTPFRRCVTLCVPSSAAPCNGAIDPDIDAGHANDQMEVISKVFWTEGMIQKSIQFRERLYNWR